MIELPEAIAPWARELSIFSKDLALDLGPMATRLARALGPLRISQHENAGEPDGYDGLSRRGNFERLLPMEWAIALELPDEFLRRAVQREQAFFQLAMRQPAGSRRSIALFDAGPSQLGAPRIAQLAALIVLSQRAAAAGASFGWGLLQRSEQHDEVSHLSVRHFLDGRSASEATAADLGSWLSRLGKAPQQEDDLWLVGPKRLSALQGAAAASLLEVRNRDEAHVGIQVRTRRSANPSEVLLPLPSSDSRVRLLRDPFPQPASPSQTGALDEAAGVLFVPGGQRLIVRLRSGALLTCLVPGATGQDHHPQVFEEMRGQDVVAAGVKEQHLRCARLNRGFILLDQIDLRNGRKSTRGFALTPDAKQKLREPDDKHPLGMLRGDVLTDGAGSIFALHGRHCVRIASHARSILKTKTGYAWVSTQMRGTMQEWSPCMVSWSPGDEPESTAIPAAARTDLEAFHGYLSPQPKPAGLVAVHTAPGLWSIFGLGLVQELEGKPEQVKGVVVRRREEKLEPALLLLVRGKVFLSGKKFLQPIAPKGLRGAIVGVTASAYGPQVALVTDRGELVIYSLSRAQSVLLLAPDGGQ